MELSRHNPHQPTIELKPRRISQRADNDAKVTDTTPGDLANPQLIKTTTISADNRKAYLLTQIVADIACDGTGVVPTAEATRVQCWYTTQISGEAESGQTSIGFIDDSTSPFDNCATDTFGTVNKSVAISVPRGKSVTIRFYEGADVFIL